MYTKKIYFTAENFDRLKNIFENIRGVEKISAGKISAENVSSQVEPEPQEFENIFGAEIEFNPKKIDISTLLDNLFENFSPYKENNLGVYYFSREDEPQIELHMNFVATRGKQMVSSCANLTINDPNSNPNLARKCYVKVGKLKNFIAEEKLS
ncbi:MAG: peptide methionine sulfoxide reductase [Selenomonadaceae bacterium]|nr:peptide methionine sulfoxide reductase [Selenomonadaceae bacterium]